jgi:2-polyprenyl-3-methyl-5-hydroxy-6-metoxy-1,4-benzoquinol methylase
VINPHFDHQRVIWKDEYSGEYQPIDYRGEFDPQWKLFLEGQRGFTRHTGVETEDAWIDDRIYDLTGHRGVLVPADPTADRNTGGRQNLDLRFGIDYFRGKRCIDIACGAGRWTRAMLALGACVKSIDVSEHGLASVRRFNHDVERVNLFDIAHRRDLHDQFDFALAWGVVMSTHDPAVAFANAARTVRPGGALYVMVYAPTYHNSPNVLAHRAHYHKLRSAEEKLRYVYGVAHDPSNAINCMDMLNPFYNWVVEEETIHGWFAQHGFVNVVTLNASEKEPVAYHVFGTKRGYAWASYDDHGVRVPQPVEYDTTRVVPLTPPFERENGMAWQVRLPELSDTADDMDAPYRSRLVLLENGRPLWLRHTMHEEIRTRGGGTYSHWQDRVIFSTTDNSDPNANQRVYQIAFAK